MKGFSLSKILFSTRLTAILFIVFAAAMAVGTFLDANEETSPTALTRTMIYNAWWFEAIMGFSSLIFWVIFLDTACTKRKLGHVNTPFSIPY